LTIDFGGLARTFTYHDRPPWYRRSLENVIGITPAILLQICEHSEGLKLRHVQLSSLPDRTELTPGQISNLNDCIESILMLDADKNYRQKYFPPKAEIKLRMCCLEELTKLELSQELNVTLIYFGSKTIGVKCNAVDLNFDPKTYKDLLNHRKKILKNRIAQSQPIYIDIDSLVNFKLDVCLKLPNLKVVHLFAWFGFRDHNDSYDEFQEIERKQYKKLKSECDDDYHNEHFFLRFEV
jgi:hypothetical protein